MPVIICPLAIWPFKPIFWVEIETKIKCPASDQCLVSILGRRAGVHKVNLSIVSQSEALDIDHSDVNRDEKASTRPFPSSPDLAHVSFKPGQTRPVSTRVFRHPRPRRTPKPNAVPLMIDMLFASSIRALILGRSAFERPRRCRRLPNFPQSAAPVLRGPRFEDMNASFLVALAFRFLLCHGLNATQQCEAPPGPDLRPQRLWLR